MRGGADAVAFLASGGAVQPDDLFVVTLRLIETVSQSDLKRTVEGPLCAWVAGRWLRVIEAQRFALWDPRVNAPAIARAVAASAGDLP